MWTAVALLDGGLLYFFVFCFVRLPIVDGTGCLVWWSVEFVFRNVDGTGIFSVLLYPMFWIMYRYMSMSSVGMVLAVEVGLNDGFDSMSVFIIQPS